MLHESRTTRYLCTYEAEQRDIQHFEEYVRNHYQKLVLESKKRQGVLYLLIFWFVYSAWMNYSSADPETLSYSITIPSINTNVDDSINKVIDFMIRKCFKNTLTLPHSLCLKHAGDKHVD
eukprot:TRINITY_DN12980_c0_g1_i2.p1 TRINITY_DN12980_c0_g1~~TRINITY_DN12980_c0_g1_i2.p1  ORF type:complete len:120 (+),score=13.05 TRINITY_DN12980_c0_g1_i2:52-411(+)